MSTNERKIHFADKKYGSKPKIIKRHGYPAEQHIIQSEDGYLLEYHRIPHGKNAPAANKSYPVLLHHGLTCTSIVWIINGPEKSLGKIMINFHDILKLTEVAPMKNCH